MPMKLPSDLEEEILSRVPCRSLARFRCVCKLWNSVSLEDRFIQNNFSRTHNYNGQHRFILLDHHGTISSVGIEEPQQYMVNDALPSLTIEDLTLQKNRPVVKTIKVYKIVYCDGLLLCVMNNQLLVWNPLLKETRWVKCGADFHAYDDAYSLGYIKNHCDYRILRFRCATTPINRLPRVEVYEFESKTWKVINISFDWVPRIPLSILSLRGTPYCIGLRRKDDTAFLQSFDFSKNRFQPIDDLPFRYDGSNPLALEIFRGDRISVLEQCHKTRKICIWVKHSLMIPSWSKLMVVAIPHFPLLHPPLSRFSTNYFLDKNGRLVVTFIEVDGLSTSINICRVIGENEFRTIGTAHVVANYSSCNYVPSLVKLPGLLKQDTSRIRWRRSRFN